MHRSHTELQHDHVFQPPKRGAERRSANVLAIVGLSMVVMSVERLINPEPIADYKTRLGALPELVHVSIEAHRIEP